MTLIRHPCEICRLTTYTFIHDHMRTFKVAILRSLVALVAFRSSYLSDPHYVLTSQSCVQLSQFISLPQLYL